MIDIDAAKRFIRTARHFTYLPQLNTAFEALLMPARPDLWHVVRLPLSASGAPLCLRLGDTRGRSWLVEYNNQNFIRRDPLVAHAHKVEGAFSWADPAIDVKSQASRQVMAAAADHGLLHGVCSSHWGLDGSVWVAAFGGKRALDDPETIALFAEISRIYMAVAWDMTLNAQARPALLTPTQVRVVEHLSRGLRLKEIAAINEISIDAVKGTVGRARRRLGASNDNELIALAIGAGIISAPALRGADV
jgi:DNA-binding CsgD family transcriptional regulator